MAEPHRYDPRLDELLQRTRAAILRSQELIAKSQELQRQTDRLKEGKREPEST